MAGDEKPAAPRFGLDEDHVADVRALAKAVADGTAILEAATVIRAGQGDDYLRTTLTVTLLERKRDK